MSIQREFNFVASVYKRRAVLSYSWFNHKRKSLVGGLALKLDRDYQDWLEFFSPLGNGGGL